MRIRMVIEISLWIVIVEVEEGEYIHKETRFFFTVSEKN